MSVESIHKGVARYYTAKLRKFGPTARGVDWKDEASQILRFEQLVRLLPSNSMERAFSVLDMGCGYGAMADFLMARFPRVRYIGFDISEAMVDEATRIYASSGDRARFTAVRQTLVPSDFVF